MVPLLPRAVSAAFCNSPSVQSLSQQHGAAGATVTINGSGFSPGVCTLLVSVGAQSVPNPTTDGSHISFTAGAGWNGPVSVSLRDANGQSNTDNHLIYVTDPTASGLDNSTPTVGATVHLQGGGFTFGNVMQPGWEQTSAVYRWTTGGSGNCASGGAPVSDDSHITLQMPSQYCDGAVDVTISVPSDTTKTTAGDSSRITFKLSAPFDIAPSVSGMSRSSAVPGQTVTISGSGFGNQGGSATLNGVNAPSSWTETSVVVTVPSTATSGALTLTRGADAKQFSPSTSFGVNGSISGLSPGNAAAVGDTITVNGAGFGTQTGGVTIAGTAISPQQWSPSTIVFAVPDGLPPGGTTLAITTSGTNAPPAQSFTVLPRITGTTPAHAPAGSLIEIDGTTFGTQQGSVKVGGQDGTVTLWGDKSVLVSLPAGAAPGPATITLTPPGTSATATAPFTVDDPPPPTSKPGGSSGGSSGGGSSSGSGGSAHNTPVPGTPGAVVAPNGLILPSDSGPIIAHGPVQFVKPSPPPGPVSLKLDAAANQGDPGADVPFTVTLIAFGKPVVGAPVDLLLVIEPGSDAKLNPAHAVTDAAGRVTGTIHLSGTAGDHIVLARSGIYSDEVRVVGRSATAAVASGRGGASADGGSPLPSLVSVRSPVLWALIACVLLFGAGFGLNLVTAPSVAGRPGAATATARSDRDRRAAVRDITAAAGSLARFGAGMVAVVGSLALGALRRR
jgi:hypothetical protein